MHLTWKLYPVPLVHVSPTEQGLNDQPDPRFPIGALVRLRYKPLRVRRITGIAWHCYRREHCYSVETVSRYSGLYWFAPQLIPVQQQTADEPEIVRQAPILREPASPDAY